MYHHLSSLSLLSHHHRRRWIIQNTNKISTILKQPQQQQRILLSSSVPPQPPQQQQSQQQQMKEQYLLPPSSSLSSRQQFNTTTTTTNNNNASSTNLSTIHHEPHHVSFEDFLKADANQDGRVTAAEWENYIKSKRQAGTDQRFKGLTIELPFSPLDLQQLLNTAGFGITVNGLHYSISLIPEGYTVDLINIKRKQLAETQARMMEMDKIREPLDQKAARHTRRVMALLLGYLLTQAGVVAKLTFFSRFGWDVMEPITYFITFGISLLGLVFFTVNKLEFSYPALAALITRRKAEKLYIKHGFDAKLYRNLQKRSFILQDQLNALVPPVPLGSKLDSF
jgi:hypothetical protein